MFYFILNKLIPVDKYKKKQRNTIIYVGGTSAYIGLHYLLYSKYCDDYDYVKKHRRMIYILFALDVILTSYLNDFFTTDKKEEEPENTNNINPNTNINKMLPPVQPQMRPPMRPQMQPPMRPPMQPQMQPPMQPPMQSLVQPPVQPSMKPPVQPHTQPKNEVPVIPPTKQIDIPVYQSPSQETQYPDNDIPVYKQEST